MYRETYVFLHVFYFCKGCTFTNYLMDGNCKTDTNVYHIHSDLRSVEKEKLITSFVNELKQGRGLRVVPTPIEC